MDLSIPRFTDLPILLNVAVFAGAAGVVWFAGVRLARIGDVLADRTGLGKAVFGLVFLALATSLPELSTTVTASLAGNAGLATGNLFGSVVLQTAILALADATLRRGPLTFFAPRSTLLLQGALLIALLGIAVSTVIATELLEIGWIGVGSIVVFVAYVGSLVLLRAYDDSSAWRPVDLPDADAADQQEGRRQEAGWRERPTRHLVGAFLAGAVATLVGGVVLARVAAALAEQTGLAGSFVGATLLAASTALPEVSTTLAAVAVGSYSMAIANVFGSNALMVGLVFVADLTYLPGPIFEELDRSVTFAATAGIVATAIYLAGLVERRDHQIWRLGLDSVVMVVWYATTLAVLAVLS